MPQVVLEPWESQGGIIVTARSHLINSVNAQTEIIHLPARKVAGGDLTFDIDTFSSESRALGRRGRFLNALKRQVRDTNTLFLDLRRNAPTNWAHFTTNHLPLSIKICAELGLDWRKVLLILPEKTPNYIKECISLFEFTALYIDSPIQGTGVRYDVNPWTANRSVRHNWVRLNSTFKVLEKSQVFKASSDFPRKVFISRRDARVLKNEEKIEALLRARGFTKIYAEDISVRDQFRLFQTVEEIVAIHGAALGPLLYRRNGGALRQVMELFSCGHVTDVFGIICEQVECRWIGVRGRIEPENLEGAYDLDNSFKKYAFNSFEIDPFSVEQAFDILENS